MGVIDTQAGGVSNTKRHKNSSSCRLGRHQELAIAVGQKAKEGTALVQANDHKHEALALLHQHLEIGHDSLALDVAGESRSQAKEKHDVRDVQG
ncbi:TPA: hypothetical protein ACH3X1_014326 [Trebouxia sp. C0004]